MRPTPSHIPHGRYRSGAGAFLVIALLLVLALFFSAVFGWFAWQFAQLPPSIAAALRVVLFVLPLVLLASAGAVGVIAIYNRWGRIEIVRADKTIALTGATVQRFPAALQSLSFHDSSRQQIADPVEETPMALPPPSAPTFGQLLDAGTIGPGRQLLLGIDAATGQPIAGSWRDLYSTGVGGMTGSGKSWLGAFLIAQSVAAGARLIVIDPHAGDSESLATRIAPLSSAYMCDVASDPRQIESALRLAADKLTRRTCGQGGSWPLLLVCDEWTSLLRGALGDVLTHTALNYAEQGRKFGCFALLAAQAWQIDAAGPVRDRLASHYVMRQRPDQARYQLGLRAGQLPLDVRFLSEGQAYLLSVKGDLTKVIIPRMNTADLMRVGSVAIQPPASYAQPFGFQVATAPLQPPVALEANGKPTGSQREAKTELASSATGSAKVLSPEAASVRAAILAGESVTDLARKRNGGTTSGGSYRVALAQINALVREALGEE